MKETESQLLMRYHDGECTDEERERVQARLLEDPQAARELSQYSDIQQAWGALPPALSDSKVAHDWDTLKKKLLADELPGEDARKIHPLAWTQYWTWGAVAAVFALASVVFLFPRSDMPASGSGSHNSVEVVETDLDGAMPIIFVDKQSGWTVVWVDEAAAS